MNVCPPCTVYELMTKGGGQDGMMQTVLCGDWLKEGERENHRERQAKRQFDMFQCDEVSKL